MSSTDKEANRRCDASDCERLDPLKSVETGCVPGVNVNSLPCEDINNKNDNVASTGSPSLSQTETVCPKADIEDELDKFYKELEQIEPNDVDVVDDSCNVDTVPPDGQAGVASNLDDQLEQIEPNYVNVDASCNVDTVPSDGQVGVASKLEDQPQPHQQKVSNICVHTDHSEPQHECSNSISPSYALHEKALRNVQEPHQNVPTPWTDIRPRYNLRGPNQDFSWLEQGPANSVHAYGAWAYNRPTYNQPVPNRFHLFRMDAPVCFDTYGQASSSWSYSEEYHPQHQQVQQHPSLVTHSDLSLILMRGAPGSGKSTMARELLSSSPNGLILSTDDYFLQEDRYVYDPRLLSDAHCWNQSRTLEALCEYQSPVIIDNTNMQAWEMKPYVEMALEKGYSVCFQEPDTTWRYEPSELERRNKHGVPKEKIAKMLERFELPMTVDIVLRSQPPSRQRPDHVFRGQRKRRMDMDDFHYSR